MALERYAVAIVQLLLALPLSGEIIYYNIEFNERARVKGFENYYRFRHQSDYEKKKKNKNENNEIIETI